MRTKRNKPGLLYGALLAVVACGVLLAPPGLHGLRRDSSETQSEDRVGIFTHIEVTDERPAADVACAFCSVHIGGPVHGDVAVLFGHVKVEPEQTISGDVATLFSSLSLGENARIGGDVATAFGRASIAPGASVGGDRAIFSSGLGLAVLLAPLLILAGVIWLLVWAVRRLTW